MTSAKTKREKIQILALHLGYGGTERATIDMANMLSLKYDVEIVSLYKLYDTVPYKVDPKVKITFLTNLKPNKKELIENIKSGKIIRGFREGCKSVKILYLKYKLIKDIVSQSDASCIISTRLYFTNILSKYGKSSTKKIAVEHNYFTDDKYIDKVKNASKNIDTLVCVSKNIAKLYAVKIPRLNVIYIPNVVSDEFNAKSNLNNKKLVSVGRLEPEKGSLDLIDLMKEIRDLDSSITLDVFGEGSLQNRIIEAINESDLKNITLHGFKDAIEINKFYKEATLFVMTSFRESFGIVLVEAMKCGIPAIAFIDADGAKAIIEHEKNGFLIKNRNIKEMAKTIVNFINSDKKIKMQFSKNALATAEKYSYENVCDEWFKIIKQ